MAATLPSPRSGTSAVWDGTHAYIFGGANSFTRLDEVLRYNPTTDTITTMGATLPSLAGSPVAVWTGSMAYIFGGYSGSSALNTIARYNPATDTMTTMTAVLPTAADYVGAIWDGAHVYLFGGMSSSGPLNAIVRYNPTTDTVATMAATLPVARSRMDAVWDGTHAYIFGGQGSGAELSDILRYNPVTDTLTTLNVTMPASRQGASTVWDGTHIYVFGGSGGGAYRNEILRYHPATNTLLTMHASFPDRIWASAVWDGTHAYVFGGGDGTGFLDEIVRYDLAPGAPINLTATSSSSGITLSWQDPASNTHSSPLTGFNLYRGNTSGGETFFHSVGPVNTYTDTTCPATTTCYYTVSAVNAAGEGPQSSEASATAPGDPPLAPCTAPGVGLEPDCHTAGPCPSGYGVQVDGSPTCLGPLGPPTAVTSCAIYNAVNSPAPYPGQNVGVVLEYDPPGPEGDVALCAGTATGDPCAPGQPGIVVGNEPLCVPPPPTPCPAPALGLEPDCHDVAACDPPTTVGVTVDGTGACVPPPTLCNPAPGPGWTVGAEGICIGLPWAQPDGAPSCPGATVNVRVHWGTTPGFTPGSTFDVCL